jgi:hypothetical protein
MMSGKNYSNILLLVWWFEQGIKKRKFPASEDAREGWIALEGSNVLSLRAFLALTDFESNFLSVLEGNATGCCLVDLTEVYEYITVTIVGLDKSVAFFVVEPFNGSILQFCHGVVPFLKIW